MRILLAPNAMKGSLSAYRFADAMEDGLLLANKEFKCVKRPLADGGDGTAEVLVNALNGEFISVTVTDPLGRKIKSHFGWIHERKLAIIEMADASGIKLLSDKELDPMIATSFGTGELISEAIKKGATRIILGIGGSATVDGGIGILKALGFELTDKSGNIIQDGGAGLNQLVSISAEKVSESVFGCEIIIATDVTNPLLGENGSAKVYGPQKGAAAEMIPVLEAGLKNLAQILQKSTNIDLLDLAGGGAAGGVSIPLITLLNAKMRNGAEYIFEETGIMSELETCDLVVTGEGCVDSQTSSGKGPSFIANEARKRGIPVIAIGGIIKPEAFNIFDGAFSITNGPLTLECAMENAYELTKNICWQVGKVLKL